MPDNARVKEITAKLEQGVIDIFSSEKYADYLKTMSRFHSYSTRNTLLIHTQRPDATLVAGFQSWQTKFSRHVKRGEKAIKILAPVPFTKREEKEKLDPETRLPVIGEDGRPVIEYTERQLARFKVTNVFDVKQTDGEPLPTLVQDLAGNVEQYEAFMDALRAASPLPISIEPMPQDTDGICYFGDRIAIREGMSEIQTVCAIIHEITHAKLHDIESLSLMDEAVQPKDRRTQEVEAESISYVVSQYFNIETSDNSFGYVIEWSKSRELKELNASLDTIRKTAAELIDNIDSKFQELVKERNITVAIGKNQLDIPKSHLEQLAETQTGQLAETQTELYEEALAEPETKISNLSMSNLDYTEPIHAAISMGSPTSEAVYARYCNQIADAIRNDKEYKSAVLSTDEESARTACEYAVRHEVYRLYIESADDNSELLREYSENPDFRARLEDYVFMHTYHEGQTIQMSSIQEIMPFASDEEATVLNENDSLLNEENIPLNEDITSEDDSVSAPTAAYTSPSKTHDPQTQLKNTAAKISMEIKLYDKFAELFPQLVSGEYSYLRFEAGDSFTPLSLEWLDGSRISVMHTYILNGDLCYDPMIVFRVGYEGEGENTMNTLTAIEFQQSIPPLYQVEDADASDGRWDSIDGNGNERTVWGLQKEINEFASNWLNNIAVQGYMPVHGTLEIDGEDVRISFDSDGNPIMPELEQAERNIQIGDILQIEGATWSVEEIDGDFSLKLKNLNPKDMVQNLMYAGRWKEKIEKAGYSFISISEQPTHNETAKDSFANITTGSLADEEPAKEYDLSFAHFGNGLTVWNHLEEKDGDYIKVAHIGPDRIVKFYDNDFPQNLRIQLDFIARTSDESVSTTQPEQKVFHTPPKPYLLTYFDIPENGIGVFNEINEQIAHVYDNGHVEFLPSSYIADSARNEIWAFAKDRAKIDVLANKSQATDKATERDLSLPDHTVSISEMNQYGYFGDDMLLPLTSGRAVELFDFDHCIYLLHNDDTESIAIDREEIRNHDGLCGIEREDWERSPIRAAQLAIVANSEGSRESELLHNTTHGGMFGIYQIPDGMDEARNFRFTSMREMEALGLSVDRSNYKLIHTAPLTTHDTQANLNEIFKDYNDINRPADFSGRSVSVSDIIVFQWQGEVSSHYVDSVGFVELESFLGEERKNAQNVDIGTQSVDDTTKPNELRYEKDVLPNTHESYSQVGNKQGEYTGPTTAELEADVNAGKSISLVDLSRAANAERSNPDSQSGAPKGRLSLKERLEEGKRKASGHGQQQSLTKKEERE